MEIDHQEHLHRRCLRRESMRKLTEPELERASPESPLRLAPVRWPNRIRNDTLSAGTRLFTPLDKRQTKGLSTCPQELCPHPPNPEKSLRLQGGGKAMFVHQAQAPHRPGSRVVTGT